MPAPYTLLNRWTSLVAMPGGPELFSAEVARMAPYTGSIAPRIRALGPGHAVVSMDDAPALRNHLGAIHAVALANLGEVACCLAFLSGQPDGTRACLAGLAIAVHRRAQGPITARCRCAPVPRGSVSEIEARIEDEDGSLLALVTARWDLAGLGDS
ncbi:MAG: DUF4442 domain-containing protein [Planctomycetes bacterium]|nr:DUF4442 domain-containing protein [Planctomycetota bacterium]